MNTCTYQIYQNCTNWLRTFIRHNFNGSREKFKFFFVDILNDAKSLVVNITHIQIEDKYNCFRKESIDNRCRRHCMGLEFYFATRHQFEQVFVFILYFPIFFFVILFAYILTSRLSLFCVSFSNPIKTCSFMWSYNLCHSWSGCLIHIVMFLICNWSTRRTL